MCGRVGPGCYPQAITMMERGDMPLDVSEELHTFRTSPTQTVPPQEVITHRLDMRDVVKGIKMVTDSRNSIKVILLPNF